jgi:hypothetical protein
MAGFFAWGQAVLCGWGMNLSSLADDFKMGFREESKRLLFLKKKKQKNFCSGGWWRGLGKTRAAAMVFLAAMTMEIVPG